MILALLGCGSPHDVRPPRTIPDEVRLVQTLDTVEIRATLKAVDHPPRTAGWDGSEIGPVPSFGTAASVESWVEVRAWSPAFVPVIIDRPEPAGYLLAQGPMRRSVEEARADQAAITVTSCWSADHARLALLSGTGGWVVIDFAGGPRIGQFFDGSGDCTTALTAEPLTWHGTQPR